MKGSSGRRPEGSRPQVRAANPNAITPMAAQPQVKTGNNYSGVNGGFVEEPYRDPSASQTANANVAEVPFDYSLMGKPNSSAVMQNKKKSSSKSSSSKKSSMPTAKKAVPVKKHKKKKASSKKTAAVMAIAAGVLAIGAGAFGIMYAMGVFKPRIEVIMADGTVQKIKAEDAWTELTEGEKYYQGTVVNDIDIGGMTRNEAYTTVSAALDAAPLSVDIDLKVNEDVYDLDLSSLTLTVNTNEILAEAYALNRPTDPEDFAKLTECYNAYQQMKNSPYRYQTAYTCSTEGLNEIIHSVLDPLNVEEHNAEITGFNKDSNTFEVQPETNGFAVDSDKAAIDVKNLLDERIYEGIVEVDNHVVEPEVKAQFFSDNFGLISTCSSSTSNNSSRNTNINQACVYIDGTVLNPGDEFSFNGVVGMRTAARGFAEATVILGGKYEQGFGGGICQVSTMCYGAAIMADMEIVRRQAHAWPSSYCAEGLDATVDWGSIDFVFRNSSEYPVAVRAHYSNRTVTVQIYGKKFPDGQYIKFTSEVTSTTPAGATEYVENRTMDAGQTETVRSAHDGMVVKSYKIWYDANGQEIRREDVATTNYRMYSKKVEVGTKLPNGGYAQFNASDGSIITPTPTPEPTAAPTATPTPEPTAAPTATPTPEPTTDPGQDPDTDG